jgi:hypothetical protein
MTDDQLAPVGLDLTLAGSFTPDPAADAAMFTVSAGVLATVTVDLLGLTVVVDGIEQAISIDIGGRAGAPFTLDVTFDPPLVRGASATVDLPAVTGQGDLIAGDGGSWSGALFLALSTLSVDAFALIDAEHPVGFVIVLCARFPQPGIQVGFGFAVTGVGGVFGLNRRADTDALTAAVLDGSLAGLLFPSSAHDDATRIVANLGTLFPRRPGQLIVGPMLEITWAGGLLSAEVMVLVELPDPVRVSVLGRLSVDLPYDDAAVVHIEARVGAFVTPSVPELRMVASVTGSTIAGFPLTGDLFLLIRGGPEATFVFSAGGFHPAAHPPPNTPPLKRLGMAMSLWFIELRCENYLAVTTSSVQLGAAVELTAEVDGCGIHGGFSFDALIEWQPQFQLRVDVHILLAVEVFGENLYAVSFDGHLAGPGPWHLNGRAKAELLWVSVPISIDATFGAAPKPLIQALDVGHLLAQELTKPGSWTVHPPPATADGVTLSAQARTDLAAARVLHPAGGLRVAQRLVPLSMVIDRFGGYAVPDQRWEIGEVQFGDEPPRAPVGTVEDTFADGTFTTLTAEQQLTVTGFTSHTAGVEITPTGLMSGTIPLPVNIDWDNKVVGAPAPPSGTDVPLSNLAKLIPARGPLVAVTGNPVTTLTHPPLVSDSGTGALAAVGVGRVELWETG